MQFILILVLLFGLVLIVNGSHFLGGTITWRPLNDSATGTPVAIVITQTYSWTYLLVTCTSTDIATSQYVPSYASLSSQQLQCIANCGAGSTGYSSIDVIPRCTDISSSIGTTVGQRSDTVYLQAGDDFSVAYQAAAWRFLASSLTTQPWSIATRINVTPRPDNGRYNNAPVAIMMSPINIPVNQPTAITVPVADADGDPTRCRWSTSSNGVDECGGVCPPSSLPTGTIIYPNCTVVITGQTVDNWFSVTLMVEDFINSSSTTPLSSVPVQFLVHVVNVPPCVTPPDVVGIPIEQSCTTVQVGQTFTSELVAINNCGASVSIVDIATLSFPGMVKGALTQLNITTYYKNLSWTPTSAQLGYQVICAMAFDSQNAQSDQYCFKFYVTQNGVCACPGDVCITTSTTTATSSTSTSATTDTTTTETTSTTTTSTTSTETTSTSTTSTTTSSTSSTTSTTSVTSTTSTSTTSTTSTSTTTTSITVTTTKSKSVSINWPLIGSLIALTLLGALSLISFLCWKICCFPGGRGCIFGSNGPFELYHIDRCTDLDCHWRYISNYRDVFSASRKSDLIYNILGESTCSSENTDLTALNPLTNSISCSTKNDNDWAVVDLQIDSSSSKNNGRSPRKPTAGVSVSKISVTNRIYSAANLGIKPANHETDDVKVTRVQSITKPRAFSFDDKLPEQDTKKSDGKTPLRRKSIDAINIVRVSRINSQPPILTDPSSSNDLRQSIIDNTIQLDSIDEERKSSKLHKNKRSVKHVPSAHQPITNNENRSARTNSNDLSLNNSTSNPPVGVDNHKVSLPTVRVERITTAAKKNAVQPLAATIMLESVAEETVKSNKIGVKTSVTVERVLRKNTAK